MVQILQGTSKLSTSLQGIIHLCYASGSFKYSERLSGNYCRGILGGNDFKRLKLTYSSVLSIDANGVTPIPPATQRLIS